MPDPKLARGPGPDVEPPLEKGAHPTDCTGISRSPAALASPPIPRCLARTLYNAADALLPPGDDGAPGGGDRDLLPGVERRLLGRGPGAARRLTLLLVCIEWQPVACLRSRRPFSRLVREEREAWLAGWEASRLRSRRRALVSLRALLQEALREADAHSSEGA